MATIRFAVRAPLSPNLSMPGVPAEFARYVCDINDEVEGGVDRIGRMRYMGRPFNVIELGPIDSSGSF